MRCYSALRPPSSATIIRPAIRHQAGRTPSGEDIKLTRQLVRAGELLGVKVHDHLILGGPGRFASLAERGQLS
jgi:DNA repair protein RadC